MDELMDAITVLVSLVPPEKVKTVASCIRGIESNKASTVLPSMVGTPVAGAVVRQLALVWQKSEVGSNELASMLLTASYVYTKATTDQSTELVWTGPTTPFVSARRTQQVLLEVINSAKNSIFITSFVAYDLSEVIEAINSAIKRGVRVSILLELSKEQGGSIDFDIVGKMKKLVPEANFYAWRNKEEAFREGRVHAKIAVADSDMCFITSANLTGYAMEKNIEAGLLVSGTQIPEQLREHLNYLVELKIIELVV